MVDPVTRDIQAAYLWDGWTYMRLRTPDVDVVMHNRDIRQELAGDNLLLPSRMKQAKRLLQQALIRLRIVFAGAIVFDQMDDPCTIFT
jgi:hypothetical protein